MLPANAGASWTFEEEKRLYDETGRGMPVADIAAAHDRRHQRAPQAYGAEERRRAVD